MIEFVIIDTRTGESRRESWAGGVTTLGSAADCGLVLPGEGVAEHHCRLEPLDAGLRVVDLGSPGGTRRNDQLIGRAKLKVGDVLQIGRFRIVVAGAAASEAPAPPAPAAAPEVPAPVAKEPPRPDPVPRPAPAERPTAEREPAQREPEVAAAASAAPAEPPRPAPARRRTARPAPAREPEEAAAAATAVQSEGPARRRRSTSSAGMTVGVLVVVGMVVIGLMILSSKVGSDDEPAPLTKEVARIQTAIEGCDFIVARGYLEAAQLNHEGHPDLVRLANSLSRQESRYQRAKEDIETAVQFGQVGDAARAVRELEAVSQNYATLRPIRDEAFELLERYQEMVGDEDATGPYEKLRNPRDIDGWLAEVDRLLAAKTDADGEEVPGDYEEALRIVRGLQPADVEQGRRIDAAHRRIQDDARASAQRILDGANRQIETGRVLVAINYLQRREIAPYEGTEVWYEMLELADVVESMIDELGIPEEARPTPRREHAKARPDGWISRAELARVAASGGTVFPTRRSPDEGRAPTTTRPSTPSVEPAPVAVAQAESPEEVTTDSTLPEPTTPPAVETPERSPAQMVAEADAALATHDFALAAQLLEKALEASTDRALRRQISRKVELAQRPLWLASTYAQVLEARMPSKAPNVELRDGGSGAVLSSDGFELTVAISEGERTVKASDIAPRSLLMLTRRLRLQPEDHLNRAWLALAIGDEKTFSEASEKVADDVTLQASLFSALAFQRGLDDIPDRGFFRVDDAWMTFEERQEYELSNGLKAAFALFARADKEDEALARVEELYDRYPSEVIDEVEAHLVELADEWQEAPEREKLVSLQEQRQELETRRDHALELIFDQEKYFYPYRVPDVTPEKAQEYIETQKEVDRRVQAVRDLWGREHGGWEGGGITISSKTGELVDTLHRVRDLLWYLAGDVEIYEGAHDAFLLPRGERVVHLRNYAMNIEERDRLDQDLKVRALNEKVRAERPGELTQVQITNDYRVLMGRCRLAWNQKIHAAARWHAEWMGRTGIFGHFEEGEPERRTPGDRMAKEGYTAGGGENCAISGSPSQAHYQWVHSSGHHRNILWESHTEMSTGNAGRYWVQNFGGGTEYQGNLTE